jgi:flagellar hook-length control protein FliK
VGSTEISSIGKIFATTAQPQSAVSGTTEEDLKIQFVDLLSKMTTNVGSELFSSNGNANAGKIASKETGTEYSPCQYKDSIIKKQDAADNRISQTDAAEKAESYEADVKEVLKENLDVTDEQISEAMETLGLTAVDLLNPNQLANLVAELTGQETSDLLCDGDFVTVMQEVSVLSDELLQELGVTKEQLSEMCEALQTQADPKVQLQTGVPVETSPSDEALADEPVIRTEDGTIQNQTVSQAENAQPREVSDAKESQIPKETAETEGVPQEKTVEAAAQKQELVEEADNEESILPEENTEGKDAAKVETKEQNGAQNREFSRNGQSETQGHTTGNVVTNTATDNYGNISGTQTATNVPAQFDVENIIRQIAEYTKVTIANGQQTTMEMELNPANLGKIFLEVSSKNGVVSASIMAQNAEVKAALEAQIADLKQNLNQAGVKVDAVEVAVGSHEFEHNLEDNAKREERQAEEQERTAKSTRHLNLNSLDDLAGLMTEEESLVAQMMADQGNTVDFTA